MICWLIATKPYKHLSNHFILKSNEKFMVFTSKKITGAKFISNKNIEGRNEAQYIVEKIHQVDPAAMIIKKIEKGLGFYLENQESLQPLIMQLTNA